MNLLADFHLLRPWWLLALLPALLLWLLILNYRQQSSAWQRVIAPHLQQLMLSGQLLLQRNRLALPVLLLCWLLSVLALAGPSWQQQPQPAFTLNKATVLVVDMSMSMRATDMSPDRFSQQRFKALDFIDELAEGELALISFAGDAFVISPLTPDFNNVRLLLNELKPELMPVQGSNIAAALAQASDLLRQAGQNQGDVVLFTDGFSSADYSRILQQLDSWPHRLSVMAFGTEQGAPVQLESGQLLKDSRGAVVIPQVPLSQLAALARKGRGSFAIAGSGNDDIARLLATINSQFQQQAEQTEQFAADLWQDNAVYLVWLLLPLALYLAKRAPVLVLLPLCYFPDAKADVWRDLWQTPAQQAIADYQQEDYQQARQKFSDPLWQGNAAYRLGDYAGAARAFSEAAAQQPTADAYANLGNSLAMQQKYDEALASYQQALALNPEHQQAKQNAELLNQLQQQQQKQQQQDGQQQDGEQQQGEQQAKDGSDNSEESAGDSEDQGQSSDQQNNDAPETGEPGSVPQQQDPDGAEQEQPDQQASLAEQQEQQQLAENEMQQAIREMWPNANQEEQQQLDNLLRKVQDDPGLLLRNRMSLEYQKRRQNALPKGVEQEW
ncbi:VWA domain-containing protein [Arsukibacterium indicum]|uniref:VWA domain-containing protein n=1 Tax=Arsukibacterium indicum TaxID=2848612 RepID=A0ABS6MFT6_9GAMM|nr:VWA domain-containing protein [Arsukibacterium indicum]MBV2127672.1 VWA domain-containing protein [Arsukibacterium indicum]